MNPLIRAMMAGDNEDESPRRPKIAYDIECELLRASLKSLNRIHIFEPGMIVQMKSDLGGYKVWSDNAISIVVEILNEPVVSSAGPESEHYREPLDMIIGERLPTGQLVLFHVDSRRFEPAPE